jgi:hypothetical protein
LHTYFLPKGWIVMNSPLRERQEKNNKSLKIDSLNWISILKFKPLYSYGHGISSVILLSVRKNLCSLSFIVMTDIQNFCDRNYVAQ